MRTSFKNFRRDHPLSPINNARVLTSSRAEAEGPPSKRRKSTASGEENHEYDEDEYEKAILDLTEEWKKGRRSRSQAVVKELMDKTRPHRRRWIEQDRPMVSDVLSKFPCFVHSRTVSALIIALTFGIHTCMDMHLLKLTVYKDLLC